MASLFIPVTRRVKGYTPVTRRVKGYTRFVGKFVTGRRKRFRPHKAIYPSSSVRPDEG